MSWVVLGATGFVGSAVHRRLQQDGHEVRALRAPRLEADPRWDAEELVRRAEQHPSVAGLATSLAGADVVVNAAGLATSGARASTELSGANALLPAVVREACRSARVPRLVHLSSAAVQGRRAVLDDSPEYEPFSPYSWSKTRGEQALAAAGQPGPRVVVLRATSVHGEGRPATDRLRWLASSRWASVAGDGSLPTPFVAVEDLAEQVVRLGLAEDPPSIVLSPWAGWTTGSLLRELSGGRPPRRVPMPLARGLLIAGRWATTLPGVSGGRAAVRRVEVLWLGQAQRPGPGERPAR